LLFSSSRSLIPFLFRSAFGGKDKESTLS